MLERPWAQLDSDSEFWDLLRQLKTFENLRSALRWLKLKQYQTRMFPLINQSHTDSQSKKINLQIYSHRSGSAQHHSPGQSTQGSHLISEHEGQWVFCTWVSCVPLPSQQTSRWLMLKLTWNLSPTVDLPVANNGVLWYIAVKLHDPGLWAQVSLEETSSYP